LNFFFFLSILLKTMNQSFGINNTTKDITHSGPVAQQLSLHKGATLFTDMNIDTVISFPFGMIKQAALGTTIVIDVLNAGGGGQLVLVLGTAASLVKELNLKRIGDCAILHFFACNFEKAPGTDRVVVDSIDVNVVGFATLFSSAGPAKGGEATLEIRATNVTPGAEAVTIFSGENAFQ
jgi:hypothetical protein